MMRKVGNQKAFLVTTSVPGHHRPSLSKQLKCQSLHCGSDGPGGATPPAPPLPIEFGVRQRRAGNASDEAPERQGKPYFAAVGGRSIAPTKHAPFASNIRLKIKVDPQPRRWLKR
jgi:hypothetical protein